MAKYPKKDFLKFPHMISSIVCLLEAYNAPHDVLGDFYMSAYSCINMPPIPVRNVPVIPIRNEPQDE